MGQLAQRGSQYTDDQRRLAVALYADKGTLSAIEREMGIPNQTLSAWKKTEWWESILGEIRDETKDRRIAQYEQVMDVAHNQVMAKLPDASARDAMIIMATAQDKGRILQSLPNAYSGKADGIDDLRKQFEALAANHKRIENTVVSTQEKRDTTPDQE